MAGMMYTKAELDAAVEAAVTAERARMEERFQVERDFHSRLLDMYENKNGQYQQIIDTMSQEIDENKRELGSAKGEIAGLRELARGGNADAIQGVIQSYYDVMLAREIEKGGIQGHHAHVRDSFKLLLDQ